ncbi:hypothetical protein FYK55_11440 [Roseiconus nitratireducens]|uniref:Uncharacterized protein n=1 Tax=Roseiconus nitratireducens TaxID=2605748 RepID=A0A5M6DBT5_9BACT|nr:hypothetical protein [Roseiconus nitratireducens]KAA5543782.1 hypothetical protein FYK55_11440 [Roseiconus nitratireducens]
MPSPNYRLLWSAALLCLPGGGASAWAAGGSLTLKLQEESDGKPAISRVEIFRGAAAPAGADSGPARSEKSMPIRQTVPAGMGIVVDRQVVLELPDGPYRFRIVRGPEYRIIGGNFLLERTSLDEKTIDLPRMVDMAAEGWLAGDCFVLPSDSSLPLRMAAEDLHVAAVAGKQVAKPIPHRDDDEPIQHSPLWVRTDVSHVDGLAVYGTGGESAPAVSNAGTTSSGAITTSLQQLARVARSETDQLRVAIENPFAWELPVWLASGRIDGMFVLGDWLRLDKSVLSVPGGRIGESFTLGESTQVGRYAETVYRHAINAGLELAPLAGGGNQSGRTPVGYNRLYVTAAESTSSDDSLETPHCPTDADAWWEAVWRGSSVATNGPLLRPLLGGKLPGHVFRGKTGQSLQLQPELNLTVRDPVDYLEVLHNNQIHYSARLDEFARQGGKIPPITAEGSGWVMIRVLTLYEGHYRAAVSAPWWIEWDGRRHVDPDSVQFFQQWLADYEDRLKRLPADQLQAYVPFVQAARRFWEHRASLARSGDQTSGNATGTGQP